MACLRQLYTTLAPRGDTQFTVIVLPPLDLSRLASIGMLELLIGYQTFQFIESFPTPPHLSSAHSLPAFQP